MRPISSASMAHPRERSSDKAVGHLDADFPIFIHSLWRAGSTYIFSAFRRVTGLCCYQEPVHEFVLGSKDMPEKLLQMVPDKLKALRHPNFDTPYWFELCEIWENWKELISKPIIYDQYFENVNNLDLIKYLTSLVTHASGRPVIQECRTAGRIAGIREALGGHHIYLWRNPWDQWWSFKAESYFEIAMQLIINAPVHPEAVTRLRQEIGFAEFHDEDISKEYSHFRSAGISAQSSYSAFYLLWCLGLHEGIENADLLLNIDLLSDSPSYRRDIQEKLARLGVGDIDFGDCRVPQGYYSDEDRAFFNRLEERVHSILVLSDYSSKQVSNLLALRKSGQPAIRSIPVNDMDSERLSLECSRAREVVLRQQMEYPAILSELGGQISEQQKRYALLKSKHEQLQMKIRQQEATLAEKDRQAAQMNDLASKMDRQAGQMNDLTSKVDDLSAKIESLRTELLSKRRFWGWNEYDAVYQVWKQYRKGKIQKQEALEIIRVNYGVRSFFLLYPLYKTVKPLRKCINHLVRTLWRYETGRQAAQVNSIEKGDPDVTQTTALLNEASTVAAPQKPPGPVGILKERPRVHVEYATNGNTPPEARAQLLVIGIYMADRENNIEDIIDIMSRSKRYEVSQKWIAMGGPACGNASDFTVRDAVIKTPKYEVLNSIVEKIDLNRFEYVLTLDDDIVLPEHFVDEFLHLQKKLQFGIAQPARTKNSYVDHPIVCQHRGVAARQTRFVEIGPVVSFHRSVFSIVFPFDSKSSPMGWGYDQAWPYELEQHGIKMGIIDNVPVEHSMRPPVTHYGWKEADAQRSVFLERHRHLNLDECYTVLKVHNFAEVL